ncbi:MAG: NAD(P)/FAD-dependent oxidoreductase [Pseudorhodobacter sp.]
MERGGVSFWWADLGGPPVRRAPLSGDAQADICIIGAGYTGLWTAHALRARRPDLRILVLEAEFAGFGASGRNGGWLTGGFAWSHDRYLTTGTEADLRAMVRALSGTVDEIIAVATAGGFADGIRRTEELMVATNPAQLARLRDEIAHRRHWGEEIGELDAGETRDRIAIPGALGSMVVPGVARLHPARLVRGLARLVEGQGTVIAESTRVLRIRPGRVECDRGMVAAPVILRCTEGFTSDLPGHRRDWLPLNSAQIVTEPLSPEQWAKIGWQGHEIMGDFSHLYCYCQRTDDGRVAVGARGTPYRFASRRDSDGTPDEATVRRLTSVLHRLFPILKDHPVAHAWCGTLGVPRDWCATVGFDPATGIGHAGGYVGVGVSTSNLAGRALADLALGRQTDLTRHPWVNRPLNKWEPEPLRWLGVRGMYALLALADAREGRPGAGPSRLATLGYRLAGR